MKSLLSNVSFAIVSLVSLGSRVAKLTAYTATTTLLIFFALSPASLLAQDTTAFARDPIVARASLKHSIAEVRDAITQCRSGQLEEGLPVLKEYADAGDPDARLVMAKLHMHKAIENATKANGIELLQKNIDAGHAVSMYVMAESLEQDAKPRAISLYKQAAAIGEPAAQIRLGTIAELGQLGLRKNPKRAYRYYRQAAESGSASGCFRLAQCYEKGIGVSPNQVKATDMYRKAALGGLAIASTTMARRCFEGKGISRDARAAIEWLNRGVQTGSTEAMVLLGQRFEYGQVISKDINRAGQLYSTAAKAGDATGNYHLALLYLNGIGTNPDPVRAYVLLHAAKVLPKAEKKMAELEKKLTAEQLQFANQKIEEAAKK